jgi:O-antigen ligase
MLTTYDGIISAEGSINKEMIILGWGVCNPIGFSIGILIPLFALGTQKSRKLSVYYYLMMILCTVFAILTQSRNALLSAGVAFVLMAFFGCFTGNNKRLFRVMGSILSVGAIIGGIVFYDKISSLMSSLINMGFADNGRFSLWRLALDYFKDSPVFGIGFFSFDENAYYNVAGFLPYMAHNTLMILLSSMGTVGTVAYAIYRISTLKMFFKKFTLEKLLLFAVVAYFILSSLVDNFVFYFYTAFLYITVLAVTQNLYDRQVNQK